MINLHNFWISIELLAYVYEIIRFCFIVSQELESSKTEERPTLNDMPEQNRNNAQLQKNNILTSYSLLYILFQVIAIP